jgi:hypothetical protein
MRFSELYNSTVLLWPDRIQIDDGKLAGEEGGYFPELSKAWVEAKQKSRLMSEWHGLMVWAIYGVLLSFAKRKLNQGFEKILLKEIDIWEVEKIFRQNLLSPDADYGEMKNEYINDL